MKILGRLVGTRKQLSCRQVAEVLQSYLDREIDRDTAAKVAAHLDDCRRCGLEAETYEALKDSLHRVPGSVPEDGLARLRRFGVSLARGTLDPEDPDDTDAP